MTAEDAGKDLASVQDLMKKHDLVENDIAAHEDRVNDMNQQVSHGEVRQELQNMRSVLSTEDDTDGEGILASFSSRLSVPCLSTYIPCITV